MNTAQFNVRIAPEIIGRVLRDKLNTKATKDIITEVAFENWFTQPPEKRAQFYRSHNRKPYRVKRVHATSDKVASKSSRA